MSVTTFIDYQQDYWSCQYGLELFIAQRFIGGRSEHDRIILLSLVNGYDIIGTTFLETVANLLQNGWRRIPDTLGSSNHIGAIVLVLLQNFAEILLTRTIFWLIFEIKIEDKIIFFINVTEAILMKKVGDIIGCFRKHFF